MVPKDPQIGTVCVCPWRLKKLEYISPHRIMKDRLRRLPMNMDRSSSLDTWQKRNNNILSRVCRVIELGSCDRSWRVEKREWKCEHSLQLHESQTAETRGTPQWIVRTLRPGRKG